MSLRKKLLILLIAFIILIIVTISLCLWKGNTSFSFINTPEAVDRIRASEKLGESIELQEKDINSILGVYMGKGRNKAGVTVKGANVTFKEGDPSIKIPIVYKGIHLLIRTSGKCTYLPAENKVQYKAKYYKLGSLPIPKNMVEGILKKHESDDLVVTNSSIKVYLAMFPFSINQVNFNKNSVVLCLNKNDSFETIFSKLPQSTPSASTSAVNQGKNTTIVVENNKNQNLSPKVNTSAQTQTSSSTVKQPEDSSTKIDPRASKETKAYLSKINSQLGTATSTLKSGSEREVLQRIMGTIGCVIADPTYNYAPDVDGVTSFYKSLPPESRNKVKLAIMSNVNMDTATKIKNTFGL